MQIRPRWARYNFCVRFPMGHLANWAPNRSLEKMVTSPLPTTTGISQMALCTPTALTATFTAIPAKKTTSYGLIQRTPSLILRTTHPSFSTNPSPGIFHATPPQKYVYPDPIPEFAVAETKKFRAELMKKLSKEKATFGDDLNNVINVCTEIFSEFMHQGYGGPGTLLVEPFTDMMIALKERKLPGAPLAARASLLWAQNHVDQDWEIWNAKQFK